MSEEVQDTTQQQVAGADQAAPDADVKPDGDTTAEGAQTDKSGAEEKPEVDDQTKGDQQFMNDLLVTYDLESPDELRGFIDGLAELKGKLAGEDVDDLLDNKHLMVKYQKHWAAQEAEALKEKETPEETIRRLEKEVADRDAHMMRDRAKQEEAKEAQRLLGSFNNTVNKTIRGIKEVPEEYRDFFGLFMGVDNPINDVDLTDKGTIIDLTKRGAKKLLNFEQVVIKRYLEGKAEVPKVSTTQETSTEKEPVVVKNLSEARNVFLEKVRAGIAKRRAQK